jgi:hypothetical protein
VAEWFLLVERACSGRSAWAARCLQQIVLLMETFEIKKRCCKPFPVKAKMEHRSISENL